METATYVIGVVTLMASGGFVGWHAQIAVAERRRRARFDRLMTPFDTAGSKSAQDA